MPKILEDMVQRLTARGESKSNAYAIAKSQLEKNGDLTPHGTLTAQGRKRQAMGRPGRARAQAARGTKHSPNDYVFNKKTGRATLKRGR